MTNNINLSESLPVPMISIMELCKAGAARLAEWSDYPLTGKLDDSDVICLHLQFAFSYQSPSVDGAVKAAEVIAKVLTEYDIKEFCPLPENEPGTISASSGALRAMHFFDAATLSGRWKLAIAFICK